MVMQTRLKWNYLAFSHNCSSQPQWYFCCFHRRSLSIHTHFRKSCHLSHTQGCSPPYRSVGSCTLPCHFVQYTQQTVGRNCGLHTGQDLNRARQSSGHYNINLRSQPLYQRGTELPIGFSCLFWATRGYRVWGRGEYTGGDLYLGATTPGNNLGEYFINSKPSLTTHVLKVRYWGWVKGLCIAWRSCHHSISSLHCSRSQQNTHPSSRFLHILVDQQLDSNPFYLLN